MANLSIIAALALATSMLQGPSYALGSTQNQQGWEASLHRQLPTLGHRNWIVVADSAYPDQVSPGITTIYTGASQIDTVRKVLQALAKQKHVQPKIWLDAELSAVPNSLAPGIDRYRKDLQGVLGRRTVERVLHEKLIERLDQAGQTFRVIILKTNLTLPYTSVFFELDCGYWGSEKEAALRKAMSGSDQ